MLRSLPLLLFLVAACDVMPLTREQLFGPPDAGPRMDATTEPDATRPPDTDPACVPRSRDGLFSGAVVDFCTGQAINANVGIAGQHTCTFAQKGSFHFSGLPVGCNLTVSATREGYRSHYATVVIETGGTSIYVIRLERMTDPACQGPAPSGAECRCDTAGCVAP
jgi:hypothetical protein